jgi:hypothetical protein
MKQTIVVADMAPVIEFLAGRGRRLRGLPDRTFEDRSGEVLPADKVIALANKHRKMLGLPPYVLAEAPGEQVIP